MDPTNCTLHGQYQCHCCESCNPELDPNWNPREKKSEDIFCLLEDLKVVHLVATPSSGKTVLAKAFVKHVNKGYQRHGKTAVYLNARSLRRDNEGHDTTINKLKVHDWLSEALMIPNRYIAPFDDHSDIVVVIDEGQYTYADETFWEDMYATTRNKRCTSYFILSSWNQSLVCIPNAAAIVLDPEQCMGFLPSQGVVDKRDQGLGICYDEDELEMSVNIFESKATPVEDGFRISKEARQHIFEMTNGHPGATTGFLYALKDVREFQEVLGGSSTRLTLPQLWSGNPRDGSTSMPVTYAQATSISEDREAISNCFTFLNPDVARGFFSLSDLNEIAALFFNADQGFEALSSCLHRIIFHGAMEKRIGEQLKKKSAHNHAVEALHRAGVLQASLTSPDPHSVAYFFPTVLHARYLIGYSQKVEPCTNVARQTLRAPYIQKASNVDSRGEINRVASSEMHD
ncbi:MAG: hypothetical protein Q9220_000521 [cf. Caloplaca sp. 1 TL-2023]